MLIADDPALPQNESSAILRGVATAVLAALIMATLHLGREVFVPIALAILLSFVVGTLARGLQNWHLPRAVVGGRPSWLLAFMVIFAVGGVIATQMTQLAGDLPRYESNMRAKIASLRGTATTERHPRARSGRADRTSARNSTSRRMLPAALATSATGMIAWATVG